MFDSVTGSCPAEMKAELVNQEGPLQTFASSSSSDELSQQKTVDVVDETQTEHLAGISADDTEAAEASNKATEASLLKIFS
ncbi:unnamed protein product [Protopolystoma xenopodis]|uniref:Uncharacterized protein n=1 Tax=Protopolystoma xenopodis TaxID=117903 RepID=A0A3S5FCQ5_9PLAT|nr:unnamed protein product [Protopolystoma xenopodis]